MKLFSRKKGQGLSMTVIVVAAIALIVLVVLVFIFTGRAGLFSESIEKCADKGGQCESSAACTEGDDAYTVYLPGTDCKQQQQKKFCCLRV